MALFECPHCGTKLAYASKEHPCKGGNKETRHEASGRSESEAPQRRVSRTDSAQSQSAMEVGQDVSKGARAKPVRSTGALKKSQAKEPEASGHNRLDGPSGTSHRGSSRLSAGRTAQDAAPSSDGGRVTIQAKSLSEKVGGVAGACSAFVMRREPDGNRERTSGDRGERIPQPVSADKRPKSSDGGGVSRHAVQTSGKDQSARPSPMGSRSWDVNKTIASGVADVALGPSETIPARSSAGSEQRPSKSQVAGSNPAELTKRSRGRPKITDQRPWEAAGVSRSTWHRRQEEARRKEKKT